jgi:formylglycine-generating enzyme required for sulfatase activity
MNARKATTVLLLLGISAYGCERANAPAAPAPDGMVWVPGGRFIMGNESELSQPSERPEHAVIVDGFFMDEHTVTNAQFRAFVRHGAATGAHL